MSSMYRLPALEQIPDFSSLDYVGDYSQHFLDTKRSKGDPLADAVVAKLAESNALKGFHDLLGEVRQRAKSEGGIYQEFLTACNTIPVWANFNDMKRGQRMLASFAPYMGLSLFAGSLVGGAVFQKMAMITAMTGMLGGSATSRLDETSAMVLRMAFPGKIEPGGEAHEVLVRVRLLHAAIRRYLVDSGKFIHETEVPINQQDLAITLGLFGYLNVRSLGMMGVKLKEKELLSYNLLWRYAGFVLGIDEDLLPNTIQDQQAFFIASLKHQARPEKMKPQTKKLLDDVADMAAKQNPWLPRSMVQKFLHQICRWLSGDDYVTGMELENAGEYWALKALKLSGQITRFTYYYVPKGDRVLYALGAGAYKAHLQRLDRKKGAYRVRTNESAALKTHREVAAKRV